MNIINNNLLKLSGIILLVILVGCSSSKKSGKKSKKKKTPFVEVIEAKERLFVQQLNITGEVDPENISIISSPSSGPVQKINVFDGSLVKKGELLLKIGRIQGDGASFQSANATVKREKTDLKRLKALASAGAIAGEEVEKANLRLTIARANLTKAGEKLRDYKVKAPWDGVVLKVHTFAGSFVVPNSKLIELYDPSSLCIKLELPESHSLSINNHSDITITFDAYKGKSFKGYIYRFYPEINRYTKTRTVLLKLKSSLKMIPGMSARVNIKFNKSRGIGIPVESVFMRGTKKYVYIVQNGKATIQQIAYGEEVAGYVKIISGLSLGQIIVKRGTIKIKNKGKVKILKKPKQGKSKP